MRLHPDLNVQARHLHAACPVRVKASLKTPKVIRDGFWDVPNISIELHLCRGSNSGSDWSDDDRETEQERKKSNLRESERRRYSRDSQTQYL